VRASPNRATLNKLCGRLLDVFDGAHEGDAHRKVGCEIEGETAAEVCTLSLRPYAVVA
jgi:hypothetical protein